MFIKLGIIAGIVILGGMIFSNEIDNLFPTISTTLDSLKSDVSIFGSKASNSAEQSIDELINKIRNSTNDSIYNEISETKKSSQKIIKEEIFNFNLIESIQNIFTGNSNSE